MKFRYSYHIVNYFGGGGAQQPKSDAGSLTFDVPTSHTISHRHPVGLLQTSYQQLAEAATYTTQETNIYIFIGIRTRDPRNKAAADRHLTSHGHRDRRVKILEESWSLLNHQTASWKLQSTGSTNSSTTNLHAGFIPGPLYVRHAKNCHDRGERFEMCNPHGLQKGENLRRQQNYIWVPVRATAHQGSFFVGKCFICLFPKN
jgi:hypothetical protein